MSIIATRSNGFKPFARPSDISAWSCTNDEDDDGEVQVPVVASPRARIFNRNHEIDSNLLILWEFIHNLDRSTLFNLARSPVSAVERSLYNGIKAKKNNLFKLLINYTLSFNLLDRHRVMPTVAAGSTMAMSEFSSQGMMSAHFTPGGKGHRGVWQRWED